jgi:hypothetical protein
MQSEHAIGNHVFMFASTAPELFGDCANHPDVVIDELSGRFVFVTLRTTLDHASEKELLLWRQESSGAGASTASVL